MKCSPLFAAAVALSLSACTSESKTPAPQATPSTPAASSAAPAAAGEQTVEVACGSCVYHIAGVQQCTLAAKIGGKPMLVTGGGLDAHAAGLCSGAKQAVVTGKIEGDKFVATKVELKK